MIKFGGALRHSLEFQNIAGVDFFRIDFLLWESQEMSPPLPSSLLPFTDIAPGWISEKTFLISESILFSKSFLYEVWQVYILKLLFYLRNQIFVRLELSWKDE